MATGPYVPSLEQSLELPHLEQGRRDGHTPPKFARGGEVQNWRAGEAVVQLPAWALSCPIRSSDPTAVPTEQLTNTFSL